ncbi:MULTISPECIES: M42 family metallopeptidase [unclassified Staphylococcus]|uniref:M42 family metallopeptidase n=1 Tax=unclassified Staphylococcus TaxID=91994 RepID=UPI0021D1C7BE|nr:MULTISPECIES: M42 family metallopeptidase [unclassified Staphylococcus]UXR69385.1 M42 family metallopeptidase [Staphylococcus sp. IVB6246]UXR71441.1 M42 family metallopeptidase [Staphylococcus sp. IVB6240]UXR73719.1 M42 family metallopeptidase [Staphylococcus sp. IVB6238]UXR76037.1 M42 family metallopeptidase [Staphylococcus sp. IVB6233]UXR80235.1 M42 family metallopeptidase [Staphylococcus sp. IVB6218]
MSETKKLLKHLTDLDGIAGHEYDVKKAMKELLEPNSDEMIYDNLGGVFGKKASQKGKRTLMIAGHLDEIGFIVTKIDDDGFIKFTPIGGWWNQVMLSQKVTITTEEGKKIRGIIGSKPPHVLESDERQKPVDIKKMFIDIGVRSKEEVEAAGIDIGDMITPYSEFETLLNDDYMTAKAFDNRYGCALAVDVLRALKDESVDIHVVSGANVQEEVGLRGAQVAAHKIKPDLAIAVDVGVAYDTPGMTNDGDTKLGDGPLVINMDASNIGHVGMIRHIKKVAKEKGIELQWDSLPGGGTDAGSIHKSLDGIPSIALSVPLRYMHSNVSVMSQSDYEQAVKLVVEFVKSLNDDVVDNIIW